MNEIPVFCPILMAFDILLFVYNLANMSHVGLEMYVAAKRLHDLWLLTMLYSNPY